MNRKSESQGGTKKSGAQRRAPRSRGQGGGMPRVMIGAVIVIVVGGALLFWPRGGKIPTGIGEHQSVVTIPAEDPLNTDPAGGPRSGDVDLAEEEKTLQPEEPVDKSSDPPPSQVVEKTPSQPEPKTPVAQAATTTAPATLDLIKPLASGPYVVQTGSFGQASNADKEAARLKELGWDARVKVGNTSDGDIVYRVRISYFQSRQEALDFIAQNKRWMSGAIAIHR
jgi:cell division protein FtsN